MAVGSPSFALLALGLSLGAACPGCDEQPASGPPPEASAPAAPPPAAPAPAEVRAPDIIVDPAYVSIGSDRVSTAEGALADRLGVFLSNRPMIGGHAVDVVAMRGARPSQVVSTVAALRRAGATGAAIKTEARDGSTQRLPLSFVVPSEPCATVAWIARDAAIDVWPVAGGRAKRIVKGLAGPDMTLGTEAVRAAGGGCDASSLVVGADDALTWGLVFDLATMALAAPGARTSAAVLVTSAVPGRKLVPDTR